MHYKTANINTAFRDILVELTGMCGPQLLREPSRNGEVLRISEPTTITFRDPTCRVLLNKARDCNPFFHIVEAMWMLSGMNDVETLDRYNKRMKNYSDDGVVFHGAYGYRWRDHFGFDQLNDIAAILAHNNGNRRCVLEMWDPFDLAIQSPEFVFAARENLGLAYQHLAESGKPPKDLPCNTHAYFQIHNGALEMTVCNRSNDMVWGLLGANHVHYSILQEYMAAKISTHPAMLPSPPLQVGPYHHFTTNGHFYTEHTEFDKWERAHEPLPFYTTRVPLVRNFSAFEKELPHIMQVIEDPSPHESDTDMGDFVHKPRSFFSEPFFRNVVYPMVKTFHRHTRREYKEAFTYCRTIKDTYWRRAAAQWITKRQEDWEAKQ